MSDFSSNQEHDWDIRRGDYTPDPESTNTYVKKVKRNYYIKIILGIIFYAVILGIIIYLLLT